MDKVSFSEETIKALAAESKTVPMMADELGVDESELEAFYAECSAKDRSAFPIRLLVTKSWLEERIYTNTVSSVAKSVKCSSKMIKTLMNTYGLEKKSIAKQLTPEILYSLFVEKKMTDSAIADIYCCATETVKKARAKYNITYYSRKDHENEIPIELYHKLYVKDYLSRSQIALISGHNRSRIDALHNEYINSGHPLAKEIAEFTPNKWFFELIRLEIQTVDLAVLFELLKEHSVSWIAEEYDLIPPAEPGIETFSVEWLKTVLKRMGIRQIADTYHIAYSYVAEQIRENNLSLTPVDERLDENTVRALFIDKCWNDNQIAKALNTTPHAVRVFRTKKGIKPSQRKKAAERLNAERFDRYYLKEGMTLRQIAQLFDISLPEVTKLRDEYAQSNPNLRNTRSPGVTKERFEFLKKQIRFQDA